MRYAVLPWGMDYHLPHHVMASVPHYRLKELHDALMQVPEYREKAMLVEGATWAGMTPTRAARRSFPCWAPHMRRAILMTRS